MNSRSERNSEANVKFNDLERTPKGKRPRRKQKNSRKSNNNSYSNEGYMTSLNQPNVVTDGKVDNDPKWYMNLAPIAKDYASLPMTHMLGLGTNDWHRVSSSAYGNINQVFYAAGVMTINFAPTIGPNAEGATAPVNIAAQELYTLVRRANSGAKNYDKTDLMMVILAMDSAYMLYEDMLRAYRVMTTFSSVNRYYPNFILNAMGYSTDLVTDIANFRGLLDVFAYKLASINIPDQLDIIKRHSWMCSNIYLDDDDVKAQSYIFRPSFIYRWSEGEEGKPTSLVTTTFHSGKELYTLQSLSTLIDSLMNPLLGSEDVGTITGDMLKAFGESGMIKIRPVEDYATLVPVYSKEVLMQIRNAFCTTAPLTTSATIGDITQVLSSTVKGPYLKQVLQTALTADGGRRLYSRPILNFISEEATPENVMVATRLISLTKPSSGSPLTLLHYGTEVVEDYTIYYIGDNKEITTIKIDQDVYFATDMDQLAINNNITRLHYNSQFNNAPANYMYSKPTGGGPLYFGPLTNLCNYIYLEDEVIKRLHEVATTSLFTVKDYKLSF